MITIFFIFSLCQVLLAKKSCISFSPAKRDQLLAVFLFGKLLCKLAALDPQSFFSC